ncbi:phage virion morphogenesis protein [Collimonas sp. H4R21]|uniref:Phage virion morphogenesis protein n=1 Tax=Collimonas rhizosphaerae TaxID=3126357 RepID=A0ABU9PUI5_9BURK
MLSVNIFEVYRRYKLCLINFSPGKNERQGRQKRGPAYHYPARPLLGFSATDRELIRDSLLRHLDSF